MKNKDLLWLLKPSMYLTGRSDDETINLDYDWNVLTKGLHVNYICPNDDGDNCIDSLKFPTYHITIGSDMSHLATELAYSAGEFQALQLIVLAAFGVVD